MGGGDGRGGVGIPVAVLAEDEVVGGAADGDGLGGTVVADLGAEVLAGEGVGGVDVVVAEQAELGGVSSAVENGGLLIAEIAGDAAFCKTAPFWAHHFFFLSINQSLASRLHTNFICNN